MKLFDIFSEFIKNNPSEPSKNNTKKILKITEK